MLLNYAVRSTPETSEDPENVRFRSTIEFPALLLPVLKLKQRDEAEREGQLDDRGLIKRFDVAVGAPGTPGAAEWVRGFCHLLLKPRNNFDAFIIRRQYTATTATGPSNA